ncbi:diacylglucosamine hydrolase like protein [Campylobacter novaezeelandiae]|uniref:Epoxyqueuosine reductase QueH n=1 Tax=Campylobacter novaezeelandiae TaxID=2267891 RepID=A0A4Q9JUE3_9BACT|nr:epoxyqueuosine reductase QueH [Campylobacter novaezeelandiae]TBR81274.1 diacylglucosamine hydrolase like protein [Campylobacter novaezeelandiae]TBR82592.1 diacylglucosamine hydrolase like protein [Campylobacter novaezeelandiae]
MLVHICCSVDSHFFLQELKKCYPDEKLITFFYDPNIHPYSEYELRYLDVKRSCNKLKIKLYKGNYDYITWLNAVRGYEDEPEKGARCSICFDLRILKSVEFAKKLGETKLTTTLLTSPKKDLKQLEEALNKQCTSYGIKFIAPDFRKNGGTQRQFALAKKDMLYHQNYCGCIYGLKKQKENKNFIDELMCPITKQILPSSIEERISLYKKVFKLEQKEIAFKLSREKFLNYRLLKALIKIDKKVVKSYILFYSHFKNSYTKFSLEKDYEQVYMSFKDEINFWDFNYFNALLKNKFKDFNELLNKPLKIKQEISLRQRLLGTYNLSPIVILDKITKGRYEILAQSEIYFDTREKIILI